MSAAFADTAYYIALLSARDELHESALRVTATLREGIVTTAWVIVELANYFSIASHRAVFLSLLQDLQTDTNVKVLPASEHSYLRGLDLYARRSDKDWSLTDCISFVTMSELELTEALTADKHFEQAGFRILLRE